VAIRSWSTVLCPQSTGGRGPDSAARRVRVASTQPASGSRLVARGPIWYLFQARMIILAAIAIVAAGAWLIARRVDVRLVLGMSAFLLFLLASSPAQFFVVFAAEMANVRTVVPICSAMGFAYVMKLTRCDRHLVHMLVRPLRHARPLLIPGGVVVGYVVNMAIVSQSSTAATVGPVLVPLVVAAGVPLTVAGAMLLLGASMGGELFNPGAVEIVTLSQLTGAGPTATVMAVIPANLVACGVALAVFWWRAARRTAEPAEDEFREAAEEEREFRLNVGRALVPLLPLAILFVLNGLSYKGYVTLPKELDTSVLILAAMLVGTVVAAALTPQLAGETAREFFHGAGFAYTHVISLIVTATAFTEGIKANGLIELLTQALAGQPLLTVLASLSMPWLLAVVGGSGIAPAVAVMKVLVPVAADLGLDPARLGAYSAVAAQLGRTMSPAAAVVMMSATVSGRPPFELLRQVTPPLLAGLGALALAAALGLV